MDEQKNQNASIPLSEEVKHSSEDNASQPVSTHSNQSPPVTSQQNAYQPTQKPQSVPSKHGLPKVAVIVVAGLLLLGGGTLAYSFVKNQNGEEYKMLELGISMRVPDSIPDLTNGAKLIDESNLNASTPTDTNKFASITTISLTKKDVNCSFYNTTNPPLGKVYKVSGQYTNETDKARSKGKLVKQFDGYFITYEAPSSDCSKDTAAMEQAHAQQKDFEVALKTIKEY